MRKKKLTHIFLLTLFLASILSSTVDEGEGLTHFTSPDSTNPNNSVGSGASEEENIDSFDVSPNSGRWNVTSDNNTDDLVTDSILRMTTVNNMTSDDITSGVGFEMDRGMRKTDGKVEYRMAASGGSNQTEWFRDALGDKCDFEEGDDDGVNIISPGTTLTVENGLMNALVSGGGNNRRFGLTLLPDISVVVLNSLKIRLKPQGTTDLIRIEVRFSNATTIRLVDDGVINSDFTTYEYDISFSSGLIDLIAFYPFNAPGSIISATGDGFFIEFIELTGNLDYATHIENGPEDTWDWEEVDNETFIPRGAGTNITDSGGSLLVDFDSDFDGIERELESELSTILFDSVVIRAKANNTSTMRFGLYEGPIVEGNREYFLFEITTSWSIITIDLTGTPDSDITYDDFANNITIVTDSSESNYPTRIEYDYILLLGHWADSDSVIGLWDQDDLVPLLNVSSHFTSDNANNITGLSDKAYFTVELLDLDGEVAYLATSDNYTDISDLWTVGKISYDVLRSKLSVTINADNLTRIDKWTYPGDFTEVSGRIPALFSHTKSPSIFTSTFCVATSWQEMKLDWIRAPFTERKWIQSSNLPGVNWLQDRWDIAYVQDNILDSSSWDLIIPFLDSFSGAISMAFSDTDGIDDGDNVKAGIFLLGIDANDGDKHDILGIEIEQIRIDNGGLHWKTRITPFVDGGGAAVEITDNVAFPLDEEPRVSFSFSLSKDRSIASMKVRIWSDFDDEEGFIDVVREVAVSSNVDDPSQEFVIRTEYFADFDHDIEWTALVEDFGFVEKDIFTDFVNAIVEPLGNFFQQIFIGIFRFFANILKVVGDLIVTALGVGFAALGIAIAAVTSAIGTLQTAVEAITTAIGELAGQIATAVWEGVGTALDFITEAIADIGGEIWTAFGTAAADIMDDIITALTGLASDVADFLDAMIAFLIPLLAALAEELAGLLEDIIAFLLPLLGALAETIWELLATVFFWLWDALGLPDVLAILDVFLVGLVQFITGIPQFVTDWVGYLKAISDLFVVLGFIWIFILPIAIADTAGGCIEKIIDNAIIDLSGGTSLLGFSVPIPFVIPWGILLFWTMLDGTVFFNFF